MCFIYKCIRSSIRNNFFLIFGLFLGIGLSAFMSQIVQTRCIFSSQPIGVQKPIVSALVSDEDYEPVINLAGKPSKAQKTPQDFQRPRYYRTELGIREKLLVAVLTSPKTIQSHGIPFNKTTNHLVDKIVFFMESEPNKAKSDVRLNGVVQFSDTRLILKPFHMLKYIADNYLDDFDYFYIVRDTTYVRGRSLYTLVKSISVSESVHAGSKAPEELTSFCMLDAGILLSNLVLKKVTQNLDWCVKNAYSDSDDANVGRCIVHSTSLQCTDGAQGLKIYSYQFPESTKTLNFDRLEKNEAFVKAMSIWPVTNAEMLYKLHIYFAKVDLMKTSLEINSVRHAILNTTVVLPNNVTVNVTWPVGNQPPSKPVNRFDLLRWDYFNEKQIFLKSDFSNVDDLQGADLIDITYIKNASISYMESKYDNRLQYKRFLNGYRKFDPARGMDYILDLAFKDVSTGKETHRRIEICKPLGKVELVPVPYVTENTRVNLILPIDESSKEDALKFIENYVVVCMEKREKTHLLLVLLYGANQPGKGDKNDIFFQIKKIATKHSDRFKKDGNKIAWLSVKLPDERLFTSTRRVDDKIIGLNAGILNIAVLDLVVKKFLLENLILLCSSNMEIRQDYLNRVRMNTIKDWQIFSPIPFSEFNPIIVYNQDLQRTKEMDINKNYGHYDNLNSDHISFYVKDYRAVRKKIEGFIPIVHNDKDLNDLPQYFNKQLDKMRKNNDHFTLGKLYDFNSLKESNSFIGNLTLLSLDSLYSMFVTHGNLTVLRAVEPGLRLRHVEKDCSKVASIEDLLKPALYQNCVEKRNFNAGTRSHLGNFILEFLNDTNLGHFSIRK